MGIFPSKEQWRKWSLPSKVGYMAFIITIVALLLMIIFFIIQNKKTATREGQKEAAEDREVKYEYEEVVNEIKEATDTICRELQNIIVEGPPDYVKSIPDSWDFHDKGTFEVWMKKIAFFNNKALIFTIRSKSGDKVLQIHKNVSDYIQVSYLTPEMGRIMRGTQLKEADFDNNRKSIFVVFR
jgi:stalled ribosome rescue protein Dom34